MKKWWSNLDHTEKTEWAAVVILTVVVITLGVALVNI